jgi:hypothetical protein
MAGTDNQMPQRGIVYSATGAEFVAEAIASARSSLRFNRVAHLIFCDAIPSERIDGVDFVRYETSGDPLLDRDRSICRLPFEQTIFLDTDTYVAANVDDLFDLLNRFDVAAAHAPGYTKCLDKGQSEAFNDFNLGVVALRRTPGVAELLANWIDIYERWKKSPPFRIYTAASDQASFRRALWESSISFFVLSPEYNYRSIFPGRLVGAAKIIHGRSRNYEKLTAHINAQTGPRIFDAFRPDREW